MTDKENDELVKRVELAEEFMKGEVEGLVEQAKRVEYAVKTGAYRKKDVLQLNELIGLLWRTFERAEVFYDAERVIAEMKNTTNS